MQVRTLSGSIQGIVVGLRNENDQEFCEIQLKDGNRKIYLINEDITYSTKFGTFEDVILHLSGKNTSRHCSSCYISSLYAFDLLENLSNSESFSLRKNIIKYGIINYCFEYPAALLRGWT